MGTGSTVRNAWPLLIAVAALLLVAFGIVLPYLSSTMHDSRGTEAKANLHSIQLAIERYAVDHDGSYPSYLIGGQAVTAQCALQADGSFSYWYESSEPARSSDVLIREGYLPEYPANPFAKASDCAESVLAMQRDVRTSITGDDPLRPGTPEAAIYGTRFGADGRLMGQVLCDPRFAKWQYVDGQTGAVEEHDTWAIIEYQFWDMWLDPEGKEPYLPFSPGQFFYKCMGYNLADRKTDSSLTPIPPATADCYILGVYGGLRSKGHDIFGEEQRLKFQLISDEERRRQKEAGMQQPDFEIEEFEYWPWARSQVSADHKMGCPYLIYQDMFAPGNRNGIADAIIFALEGGEYPLDG